MIQRHIWQDYLDVAEDLRHNYEMKEIYGKRPTGAKNQFYYLVIDFFAS